jgi:methylornithine synthase
MIPVLEKAEEGDALTRGEVVRLLSVHEEEDREALFAAARRVRDRNTGNKVFLYGFIYLSTFCRNDCQFCFYRRSNTGSLRYRKNRTQVVEAAMALAGSGVHLIDLTMGEDPAHFEDGGFRELAETVASVRGAADLPVMISPGAVDEGVLALLKEAGADWYACYQETHNRPLFQAIRPGQDFAARLEGKRAAQGLGFLTEEGILSGVGEALEDVADSLAAMRELETDQVRVMGFVPQAGTPLAERPPGTIDEEGKIIAVMRLLFPDRLIPASLDVGGLDGLKARLQAGANVVTSLVPPGRGLVGVAQNRLDIDEARRTVSRGVPVRRECDLVAATQAEYSRWVGQRMERVVGVQ